MKTEASQKARERDGSHFFKRGDVAMVKNMTLGGELIDEGKATVLKRLSTDNYYRVKFHSDDSEVDRFLMPADQMMLVG